MRGVNDPRGSPPPSDALAETFKRTEIQRKFDLLDELRSLAQQAGVALHHLALAFTLAHPGVTAAIIGPRTSAQLDDLLAAADVRLDAAVLDRIDALVAPGTDVDPANEVSLDPSLVKERRRQPPTR